jgi:hypothetical protein
MLMIIMTLRDWDDIDDWEIAIKVRFHLGRSRLTYFNSLIFQNT